MLRIYFNELYEGKPYLDEAEMKDSFGAEYCGESRLLQILSLHGGLAPSVATEAQRQVAYYSNMLSKVKGGMFYESFRLDPISVSNAVLGWRDALVSVGWNLNSGETEKLKFIREMEPAFLPKGTADCWYEILKRSENSPMLPDGTEIVITQPEGTLSRKMKTLFSRLRNRGVRITYNCEEPFAEGDLGMVQRWLAGKTETSKSEERLKLGNDGSFRILRFDTDDEAMKYVATRPADEWDAYLCQQSKQFDNMLSFLGQPVSGSDIRKCTPQVVQLFKIGNGLFEKPLNLNRILAWLESPITPLRRNLSHNLAKVLASSGGINNEEWESAISEYLDSNEKEKPQKKDEERRLKTFLPFMSLHDVADGTVRKKDVEHFNKSLRHWAKGLLSMDSFPYDSIVRNQLGKLAQQCECLLGILESQDSECFSFTELQNWCQSVSRKDSYRQYDAQAGCRAVISREGNLHSSAGSLAWVCISDEEAPAYPFDFLTEDEILQLEKGGVLFDDRTYYARRRNYAMLRTLMKTRRLTIIEAANLNGKPVKRHPLMIQLQSALADFADIQIVSPEMETEKFLEMDLVSNRSDSLFVEIEKGVVIPRRSGKESYTSLDMIIQHPFDYVCKYLSALTDISRPSLSDVERTMGNVAHRMIEILFGKGGVGMTSGEMEYDAVFNEAIDSVGLMLRQPEYMVEFKELRSSMVKVLERLERFIKANGLSVDGCEQRLDDQQWAPGCVLGSRVDMLLSDAEGKVVLDFKWTSNKKKYKENVATGQALQLSIYKWLAQKQYGGKVRAAYVLLPSMTVLSDDCFVGTTPVTINSEYYGRNAIEEVFNGYAFRLGQFAEGRIERAEGLLLQESEYGEAQATGNIFPLKTGKNDEIWESYEYFKKLR